MTALLRRIGRTLDREMEGFILRSRSAEGERIRGPLAWLTLASLPLSAVLKYLTGPYNPIDLFILCLVLSCVVFRHFGLFAIGLAVALDLIVKALDIARLGRPDLWPKFLLDTALQLAEWTVVCAFVIITLEKWATLRQIKRRTDDDLALAKSLQSSLSRKNCELQRVSLCGSIHQCSAVGGDFYYFRPFGKKMVSFCVGDVMGKGISASLLMAMVMSFVYEWGKQSCNPAIIAGRLNRRLSRLWDGRKGWFITIFYAIFDEETGVLDYAAAGQQGGFILRQGEILELATECDPPLGILDPYHFTPHSVTLQAGDKVLLYTDGVYEAQSPEGELFGVERLRDLFQSFGAHWEGEALLNKLEESILGHTGGIYTDDTTLLTLQYLPKTEERKVVTAL